MPETEPGPKQEQQGLSAAEKDLQERGLYDQAPTAPKTESSAGLAQKESASGGGGNFSYNPVTGKTSKASAAETTSSAAVSAASRFSKGYNFFLGNKKKKAGAVGGVTVGVILFFISIASGPAQFIQLAQLMQQFHFNASEDQANLRTYKLIRYIKSGRNASEARVGAIGSRLGKKMEAKMKAAGFEYRKTGPAGLFDGFKVDPDNPRFKNMSTADIQRELKLKGIPTTISSSGDILIPANENYRANRGLTNNVLGEAGYSKVAASLQARTVAGKWFGFARWHPMRKANARINESIGAYWEKIRKKFEADVKNGSAADVANRTARQDPGEDPCIKNPKCTDAEKKAYADKVEAARIYNEQVDQLDAEAKSIDGEVKSTANETTKRGKYTLKLADSLRGKLIGKATLSAISPTVVLCMIYGMNNLYEKVKLTSIVFPLIRESLHLVALGNQVMNGQDVNSDELGALNQLMTGPDGSWMNAPSIQAQLGNARPTPLSDDEKLQKDNLSKIGAQSPFGPFIDAVNGIIPDSFGDVGTICSTAGQIVIGVVSVVVGVLSGGSFSVASMFTQQVIGSAVQVAVQAGAMKLFAAILAGTAVDTFAQVGSMMGTNVDYGARLANSGNNIAKGGTELSAQQSAQLLEIATQDAQAKFESHSLAYRLFSPNDAHSAFGKMVANQPATLSQAFARMSSSFFNFGNMFSKLPHLITATASAQTFGTWPYGFAEYGYSVSDMDNSAVENPYANAKIAVDIIKNNPTLATKATKCFGVNFVESTVTDPDTKQTYKSLGVTHVDASSAPNPYDKTSTDKYDDWGCNDTSTDWLRIRFFVFDTSTMDALSCFEEGDNESCNNVGFSPPPATSGSGGTIDCNNMGDPSTWPDQSPGTADQTNGHAALIAANAQSLTCPNVPIPSGAIPGTAGKQYFAYDGCSDGCVDQGREACQANNAGDKCIKVKYRNPPGTGNSLYLCLEGCGGSSSGGGSTNPAPSNPGTTTPPPIDGGGCGYNGNRSFPYFGSLFWPKKYFGVQIC